MLIMSRKKITFYDFCKKNMAVRQYLGCRDRTKLVRVMRMYTNQVRCSDGVKVQLSDGTVISVKLLVLGVYRNEFAITNPSTLCRWSGWYE